MTVILRPATTDDIDFVWNCRQELQAGVGRASIVTETLASHTAWMTRALDDPARLFLIAVQDVQRLGYMRADPAGQTMPSWISSLCLHSRARGRGLALPVLASGARAAAKAGLLPLLADIHATNLASRKVFIACGFTPLDTSSTYSVGLSAGFDRFMYTPAEETHHGH